MRVLVAIANHGTRNQRYLDRLLQEYQSMSYDIHMVILSDIPKDLGPDVEVRVGLPAKDPWSLPFAHKSLFAERANDYDLFIYSEDDTLLTERNVGVFLRATEVLPADKIAGFMRWEEGADGRRYCPTIHAFFHWDLDSIGRAGDYTYAHFTNDHAACYILTRAQLRKAIDSGGFLVGPHSERHDLLCTAATDPYTQCGFQKVICVSHLEDFMVHHLPNHYIGQMGLPFPELEAQVGRLLASTDTRIGRLCSIQSRLDRHTRLSENRWTKRLYEDRREDVLALVPSTTRTVLSVGCGSGTTEGDLVRKGIQVLAVPIDPIIGECARAMGIRVLEPSLEASLRDLEDCRFDCLLFIDVLQHVADPVGFLRVYSSHLTQGGCAVVSVPNFGHVKSRRDLRVFRGDRMMDTDFDHLGIHPTTSGMVCNWIRSAGMSVKTVQYDVSPRMRRIARMSMGLLNEYVGLKILYVAAKE